MALGRQLRSSSTRTSLPASRTMRSTAVAIGSTASPSPPATTAGVVAGNGAIVSATALVPSRENRYVAAPTSSNSATARVVGSSVRWTCSVCTASASRSAIKRCPKRSVDTAATRLTGAPSRAHARATLHGAPPVVAVIAPSAATTRSTRASPTTAIGRSMAGLCGATGDLDVDAGDIGGVVGQQERHDAGDLVGGAVAAERHHSDHLAGNLGEIVGVVGARGSSLRRHLVVPHASRSDECRRHRVHAYADGREVLGGALGQA